jgi:SAM-dependent methyltransferase
MDVGCGMGRNPYWYVEAGAASVLGVDMDDGSLAAARQNLAPFANARVEKCSAHELDPKVHGTFDRVTCIGVLHHLAEPENALRRMWSCVAPGGDLVLWCYAKEGNRLMLPVIQSFRAMGSRLPISVTHGVAKAVTALAWPAIRTIPFRTDYYRRLRTLSFKNVESIIFDQMLPHIAHYWTRADMERLAGLLDGGRPHIEFVQGNSWHANITRV